MSGGWLPVDHACRFCLGRIMESVDEPGRFWCPCCGATARDKVIDICGCGAKAPGKKYRCRRNKHRSPSNPSEIVILQNGQKLPDGITL